MGTDTKSAHSQLPVTENICHDAALIQSHRKENSIFSFNQKQDPNMSGAQRDSSHKSTGDRSSLTSSNAR